MSIIKLVNIVKEKIMKLFKCPNCGNPHDFHSYECSKCHSIILSAGIKDSNVIRQSEEDVPKIYFMDNLLCEDERLVHVGVAKFRRIPMSGISGVLTLTDKKLHFATKEIFNGKIIHSIPLETIISVYKKRSNLWISDEISVSTASHSYRFCVYNGEGWIEKINEAIKNAK